jgi:dolichol-phosphate mannosyltransferase
MKSTRDLIVTPTYDERESLPVLLAGLRAVAPSADVLVVDDASPDGTGELAEAWAAKDPHVHVMHRSGKLGLGTAYVQAFTQGLAQGYDRFVQMDADLSHDPKYLPALFQAIDDGADVVIGSRNVPGGGVDGWGLRRHIMSKGGSLYSRAVLGIGVRDLTSGYRVFTRRALEAIDLRKIRSNGYSFMVEMAFRAIHRGLRVAEVPIVFPDRVSGVSKMNRRIFLEAVTIVCQLRLDAALGRL